MRRRVFVAPLAVVALGLALAVIISSCGDDKGSTTCKRAADVPNSDACSAIGNKLTCGTVTCADTVEVADLEACQMLGEDLFCAQAGFDATEGTCSLVGCPCGDLEGEGIACSLSGCRDCSPICGYELPDVPDVVACAGQAGALECVSNISYDPDTRICTLVGCSVCGGAG
jgi:hypothetical protein